MWNTHVVAIVNLLHACCLLSVQYYNNKWYDNKLGEQISSPYSFNPYLHRSTPKSTYNAVWLLLTKWLQLNNQKEIKKMVNKLRLLIIIDKGKKQQLQQKRRKKNIQWIVAGTKEWLCFSVN